MQQESGVGPDHQELIQALKLAAIALIAAVLMGTAVIGVGQVLLPATTTAQGGA
jgi:hypothetical protein